MEVISSAAMRKRATDWLNLKPRDPIAGIIILEEAGYKPAVMENFRKHIDRRDIRQKVFQEIRNYLRYHATASAEFHRDIVFDPEAYEAVKQVGQDKKDEYPAIIKQVIAELSIVYKHRGITHNQLSASGESNTNEQKAERVKLLAIIKACSDRIAVLSDAYNAFKTDGTLPDKDIVTDVFDPDKIKLPEPVQQEDVPVKKFELADTLEAVKKQQENWRIKLSKAENKLLYQSEKKLPKSNPMPDGPKRVKQERRIAQLREEKNKIDMAIAKWE